MASHITLHDSEACCTRPPISATYTEQGQYVEIAGFKTYKTGPSASKNAIILIYDVFGLNPQILQGADLLAYGKDGKQFQVFIPDILPEKANPSWFEPDATPEDKAAMGKMFAPGGSGNADVLKASVHKVVEEIKAQGTIEKFAVVGYCWGAKIVSLSAVEGSVFTVAGEVHPSAMEPIDGEAITVPIIVLASGEEDAEVIKQFGEKLKVPKFIDFYPDSPHGWMTTRADLSDEKSRADFEKGYEAVLSFFVEHM